jgi:hypothetical protein
MVRQLCKLTLLLLGVVVAYISYAQTTPITELIPNAKVVGSASYRVFFMKIFTATTYAPNGVFSWQQPFSLQLEYNRKITGAKIVAETIDEINNQSNKVRPETLKEWRSELTQIIPDVEKGDKITAICNKNQETLFFANDFHLLGKIVDKEFSQHFFAIWLGNESKDKQLRQALLGAVT